MSAPRYFYECGGCDHYHPLGWAGDCRDDAQRYTYDALPYAHFIMAEHAPIPPEGIVPTQGVYVGCGDFTCRSCYRKEAKK